MIKVILFDLGGVLVKEKDIELSDIEDKIEQSFGRINYDREWVQQFFPLKLKREQIFDIAKNIIFKLYEPREADIFSNLKQKYPSVQLCIATNHISTIKDYIRETFSMENIDVIFVSAEMHVSKPDVKFFQYILQTLCCHPEEILFLDDRMENVEMAKMMNFETIHVLPDTNLLQEILKRLEK